jgi:hypothetical protein
MCRYLEFATSHLLKLNCREGEWFPFLSILRLHLLDLSIASISHAHLIEDECLVL